MPEINVVFYADESGRAPVLEWLLEQPTKVRDKFRIVMEQLREKGGSLSRPYAAPLRDKIYELRVQRQNVHYRMLYFFYGNVAAVLAHGCTKVDKVDDADIDRAFVRRSRFLRDPKGHTYEG